MFPTCVKEVQKVKGRLAALNQFISWSTEKCWPFFQALKKNESTFAGTNMRDNLPRIEEVSDFTTPGVKAFLRETLYHYLFVSKSNVSGTLVCEHEGIQKLVYYVSHSMNRPQTRYQRLESWCLFSSSSRGNLSTISKPFWSQSSQSIPWEAP